MNKMEPITSGYGYHRTLRWILPAIVLAWCICTVFVTGATPIAARLVDNNEYRVLPQVEISNATVSPTHVPELNRTSSGSLEVSVNLTADPSQPRQYQQGSVTETPTPDPDLKPGFPVKAYASGGSFWGGQVQSALVGNIDGDPNLEIIVTGLARGPLYAWNSDGSTVPGWPITTAPYAAAYPSLGNFSNTAPGLEVAANYFYERLWAFSGSGNTLPGWPTDTYTLPMPSVVDIDGDGIDEFFISDNSQQVFGMKADGTFLPGWPINVTQGGQYAGIPLIFDMDGDHEPEVAFISSWQTEGVWLHAYHLDGTLVSGYPILYPDMWDDELLAGDVDGDGEIEFVAIIRGAITFISPRGVIEGSVLLPYSERPGINYSLADLDGDTLPEVVVQRGSYITVIKPDGTVFPGWPQLQAAMGKSGPAVGDVDGDGQPDIVVTTHSAGSCCDGYLVAYDRYGQMLPRFPKPLQIGDGSMPAIADIDRDGHNEIILSGSYWDGYSGDYDKIWVFDLGGPQPNGRIEWGQFRNGPDRRGVYKSPLICTAGVFIDVPEGSTFYPYVTCLADRSIIGGYTDCTFRPGNSVTRGQIAKIVSNAAGFEEDPGAQIYEDIPDTSPFYTWINRLSRRGYISGYPCGSEGEPCGQANLPYFRPNANATRGQISKIVSNAAGFNDPVTGQTFEDVAPNSTFYLWIERLASRGIMGGYPCGSEGEPCGQSNLPYFRPNANATRGQSSKIVTNAFFPDCQTPALR